ncbi:hypothetical protein [Laceyella putida]|uniref:Uncharacterized protein n=1 Tax=Laceyella putida TaxID=110101 RepID=A0ABW2RPJ1_9BACL
MQFIPMKKGKLEIPEAVMRVIDRHRQAEETSEVLPWRIQYQGYCYYYVCYQPFQSTLVVRDDGMVLSFKEVREVIYQVVHLVDVSQNLFFGMGQKHLKPKLMVKLYQMIQVLHHLAERGMGSAFLEAVRSVEEASMVLIRLEQEMTQVVLNGRRMLLKSVQEHMASGDMITELSKLRDQYALLVQTQQELFAKDLQAWHRLHRRFSRHVPLYRLDLWFGLWQLSLCYRGVLRALNLNHRRHAEESGVCQDTMPQTEKEPLLLTSIYVKNRNPRNSISS